MMDSSAVARMAPQTSLFQVFLRLRPPMQQHNFTVAATTKQQQSEPWLIVEPPCTPTEDVPNKSVSTHITLQPPNDSRKRAIERFGFTKVFQEEASQLDVFEETEAIENIRNVLNNGRDGLIATLGVTGSGKSHTILGTKSQRGLTQMTLDVLFRSLDEKLQRGHHPELPTDLEILASLQANDPSEAQIVSATHFLESVYGDGDRARMSRAQTPMAGTASRAQTPMTVGPSVPGSFPDTASHSPGMLPDKTRSSVPRAVRDSRIPRELSTRPLENPLPVITELNLEKEPWRPPSKTPFWNRFSMKKAPTKCMGVKEIGSHHMRRLHMPRPSTFPQSPDMSPFKIEVEPNQEYAVLVSMYEVYNDRIFDLLSNTATPHAQVLSTRQGVALQKGLMRRPLLFKNTELSTDRKVVAGLRKIVCNSYDEAMMVLETGLTERRVAGTGSNSVSSRSHGFFCIEVKKRQVPRGYGLRMPEPWTGGTLSVVDLAGSERARNAKTTGSTLAEAGKINESLMYLGQCLQVQSDCQQDGTKPIVPFRQCKLTELLFSNSFPSSGHPSTYRPPQKAVMIVTADPQGDFNATSQILRYSALAREVTVPRIPSVASAIIGGVNGARTALSGRSTPHDAPTSYFSAQELEQAHHEISRLAEECNTLSVRLAEEEIRRTEAELKLQAAEERALVAEQDIREDCWQEMECMLEDEKRRWRAAWEDQRLTGQEYLDGKIEILEKTATFKIHEDNDVLSRTEELERENEVLKAKLEALEQEMQTRSPTRKARTSAPKTPSKKLVLEETANTNIATNPFLASLRVRDSDTSTLKLTSTEDDMSFAEVSPRKLTLRQSTARMSIASEQASQDPATPGTAKKKTRKLTTRKWDLGDIDDL